MKIVFPAETFPGERRVCLTCETAKKLVDLKLEVAVESGFANAQGVSDDQFTKIGVRVEERASLLSSGDIIARIRKPEISEIDTLKPGAIHISFLDPFFERDLVGKMAYKNITAISLEMIPRTTLAQKMDVLSSQASLAGYVAVILGADRLEKIFPMMMTPAGTISPARVFIIGVGVAGLQAIATAKRLGAIVSAFDTRPSVEEQVQSLGAKFVKVDLGDTGETKDGYAKELTAEQLSAQRAVMAKHCASADLVITTAQLFGRKAPLIVTEDMVASMRPGSVLIDLAVETGGNVAGSKVNEEVDINGVKIVGLGNLPGRVSVHASQMLAANMLSLLEAYVDKEKGSFNLDLTDEILNGCVITHGGNVVNERIKGLK